LSDNEQAAELAEPIPRSELKKAIATTPAGERGNLLYLYVISTLEELVPEGARQNEIEIMVAALLANLVSVKTDEEVNESFRRVMVMASKIGRGRDTRS